ncbi:MAG: serine protease [Saprospiraceae bacterium]|nr:serine protease [Saprospiraceae bacterium]
MNKYRFILCCGLILYSLGSFFSACNSTNSSPTPKNIVVSVVSTSSETKEAMTGTGIILDKEKGWVLTAKHGVYTGTGVSYKSSKVCKDFKIVNKKQERFDAYPIAIHPIWDIAVLKVEKAIFEDEAVLSSSTSLQLRDPILFEGYPDGRYGQYEGKIANIGKQYLNLDMPVTAGMSGGPILKIDQPNEVVGMMLLEQKIGGSAIRVEYLKQFYEEIQKIKLQTATHYQLELDRILLDQDIFEKLKKEQSKVYVYVLHNDKKIFTSKPVSIDSAQILIQESPILDVLVYPSDKMEIIVWEEKNSMFNIKGWRDEKIGVLIQESLPQENQLNLSNQVNTGKVKLFFRKVKN